MSGLSWPISEISEGNANEALFMRWKYQKKDHKNGGRGLPDILWIFSPEPDSSGLIIEPDG